MNGLKSQFVSYNSDVLGVPAYRIEIKTRGKRVGEKLYEELMTEEESMNAYESEEMFVVLPQIFGITGELSYKLPDNLKKIQRRDYSSKSAKLLTSEEIKSLLNKLNFQ